MIFIVSAVLDAAYNAAAGSLAALAAKSSGSSNIPGDVAQVGALAGAVKSILSSFSVLLSRASGSNVSTMIIYLGSSFVIPFITTAVAAHWLLNQGQSVASELILMPSSIC